jgi:hypothetical protein
MTGSTAAYFGGDSAGLAMTLVFAHKYPKTLRHEYLKDYDIARRSMTELFDTAAPTGEFVLTLLGSIATLELNRIKERTALGQKTQQHAQESQPQFC